MFSKETFKRKQEKWIYSCPTEISPFSLNFCRLWRIFKSNFENCFKSINDKFNAKILFISAVENIQLKCWNLNTTSNERVKWFQGKSAILKMNNFFLNSWKWRGQWIELMKLLEVLSLRKINNPRKSLICIFQRNELHIIAAGERVGENWNNDWWNFSVALKFDYVQLNRFLFGNFFQNLTHSFFISFRVFLFHIVPLFWTDKIFIVETIWSIAKFVHFNLYSFLFSEKQFHYSKAIQKLFFWKEKSTHLD
jgi:hypothetical protein